jgi:hypothetical protein
MACLSDKTGFKTLTDGIGVFRIMTFRLSHPEKLNIRRDIT